MLIEGLDLLRVCILFAVLVCAAYTDLAFGKVYNWCNYTGIIVGLLVSLAIDGRGSPLSPSPTSPTFKASVIGLLFGFGLFYLAHLWGGIGLGDVKLMAAIGALVGWPFVLVATVYASLVGAVLGIYYLAYNRKLIQGMKNSFLALFAPSKLKRKTHVDGTPALTGVTIPYGFATAVGTLCAWFLGTMF